MHIHSLMIPLSALHVLKTTDTVGQALTQINEANLLSLPVMDENGGFAGILSKRFIYEDFYNQSDFDKAVFESKPVGDYMRTALPVVKDNIYVEEAALIMFENKMAFLPVVDDTNDRFIGIITNGVLLRQYADLFGIKYPRLVLYIYDYKGKMAQISKIIDKAGGNIKNLVQVDTEIMGFNEITLRIDCKDIQKVVKHLEQNGFDVREFKA